MIEDLIENGLLNDLVFECKILELKLMNEYCYSSKDLSMSKYAVIELTGCKKTQDVYNTYKMYYNILTVGLHCLENKIR